MSFPFDSDDFCLGIRPLLPKFEPIIPRFEPILPKFEAVLPRFEPDRTFLPLSARPEGSHELFEIYPKDLCGLRRVNELEPHRVFEITPHREVIELDPGRMWDLGQRRLEQRLGVSRGLPEPFNPLAPTWSPFDPQW